jgi:hypothetical protein
MEAPKQNNGDTFSNEAPDSYFNNEFPLRLMRSEEQVKLQSLKICNKMHNILPSLVRTF